MLPPAFHTRLSTLLGHTEAAALIQALTESEPATSIRLNPTKPSTCFAEAKPVPWCEQGRYLAERPRFTYDPLLHAGCYYVQEAASMFVEQAWKVISQTIEPHRVLDLCAAPGGKSTLWRSLLPDNCLLVANEPIRQRAQILAENLCKWGHPDVVVTSAFPAEFAPLHEFFDVIGADVPCSGEGMFRKDEGAVEEWSPEAVAHCVERQWTILTDIWDTLKPGGYLVYSTCTFNREENEDQVERICRELGAEAVALSVDSDWQITGDVTGRNLPVYRFFPHRTQGEGLFLAVVRKTGEPTSSPSRKRKERGKKEASVSGGAQLAAWLKEADAYKLWQADESHIVALRKTLADDMKQVCQTVRALTAGITMAEEKGRKLIPQHALALSLARNEAAFPCVELTLEQALAYLRREVLVLPAETPRGYVLACYENHPLGFLNNLGARANNLYPQEWRIRH